MHRKVYRSSNSSNRNSKRTLELQILLMVKFLMKFFAPKKIKQNEIILQFKSQRLLNASPNRYSNLLERI